MGSISDEWRVRRVAHLLRLLNSPCDSWQHVALVVLMVFRSPWFDAVCADLARILPGVRLKVVEGPAGLFVSSNGWWIEEGVWHGAQPWQLPLDSLGRRYCPSTAVDKHRYFDWYVRRHVRELTQQLRKQLRHEHESALVTRVLERASLTPYVKTSLIAGLVVRAGPPLHVALDWITSPMDRKALIALVSGEWFLARYAGNFFAKDLLPDGARWEKNGYLTQERSRICLACWQRDRAVLLEDEGHVLFECPEHAVARERLLKNLVPNTLELVQAASSSNAKLLAILSSFQPRDWDILGKVCGQMRQGRRRFRAKFETLNARFLREAFAPLRSAWRNNGKYVCRHGVMFASRQPLRCACLSKVDCSSWSKARFMPSLDHELKAIVARPFDLASFCRLGELHAEVRRLGW